MFCFGAKAKSGCSMQEDCPPAPKSCALPCFTIFPRLKAESLERERFGRVSSAPGANCPRGGRRGVPGNARKRATKTSVHQERFCFELQLLYSARTNFKKAPEHCLKAALKRSAELRVLLNETNRSRSIASEIRSDPNENWASKVGKLCALA